MIDLDKLITGSTPKDAKLKIIDSEFKMDSGLHRQWIMSQADCVAFLNSRFYTQDDIDSLEESQQLPMSFDKINPSIKFQNSLLRSGNPSFRAISLKNNTSNATHISQLLQYSSNKSQLQSELKLGLRYYSSYGVMWFEPYYNEEGIPCVRIRHPNEVIPCVYTRNALGRDINRIHILDVYDVYQFREKLEELGLSSSKIKKIMLSKDNRPAGIYSKYKYQGFSRSFGYEEVFCNNERYLPNDKDYEMVSGGEIDNLRTIVRTQYLANRNSMVFFTEGEEVGYIPMEKANQISKETKAYIEEFINQKGNEVIADKRKVLITYQWVNGYEELLSEKMESSNRVDIVPLYNIHSATPYPQSDINKVGDKQIVVQRMVREILKNAAIINHFSLLVQAGSVDRDKVEQELSKLFRIIEYNPNVDIDGQPVVREIMGQQLQGSFTDFIFTVFNMIDSEIGVFSVDRGDPNGAPETYRGHLMLKESSETILDDKRIDLHTSLAEVGRVILRMWSKVNKKIVFNALDLKSQKVQRYELMMSENPEEEQVKQTEEDNMIVNRITNFNAMNYEIEIVAGSTSVADRMKRKEEAFRDLQVGIIDPATYLGFTDYPNVEEMIQRSQDLPVLKQQVEVMSKQIEQLQTDLKNREDVFNTQTMNLVKKYETILFKLQLEIEEYETREKDKQKKSKE